MYFSSCNTTQIPPHTLDHKPEKNFEALIAQTDLPELWGSNAASLLLSGFEKSLITPLSSASDSVQFLIFLRYIDLAKIWVYRAVLLQDYQINLTTHGISLIEPPGFQQIKNGDDPLTAIEILEKEALKFKSNFGGYEFFHADIYTELPLETTFPSMAEDKPNALDPEYLAQTQKISAAIRSRAPACSSSHFSHIRINTEASVKRTLSPASSPSRTLINSFQEIEQEIVFLFLRKNITTQSDFKKLRTLITHITTLGENDEKEENTALNHIRQQLADFKLKINAILEDFRSELSKTTSLEDIKSLKGRICNLTTKTIPALNAAIPKFNTGSYSSQIHSNHYHYRSYALNSNKTTFINRFISDLKTDLSKLETLAKPSRCHLFSSNCFG